MLQHRNDFGRIIYRERSLSQKRQVVRVCRLKIACILGRFNQGHCALWHLPKGADDFGMARVSDKDDVPSGIDLPFGLPVDFRHQRTCRIEIIQATRLRVGGNGLGHAMRRKHDMAAVGNLIQILNKNGALCLQTVDDKAVVDYFVPHIDRAATLFERKFDDLDGAVYACTKTARGSEQEFHGAAWGELFSHAQCPLRKVAASAKGFPLLRGGQWADKDQSDIRVCDPEQKIPRTIVYEICGQSTSRRHDCGIVSGLFARG